MHLKRGCLLKYNRIKCWFGDNIYLEKPYIVTEAENCLALCPLHVLQSHSHTQQEGQWYLFYNIVEKIKWDLQSIT